MATIDGAREMVAFGQLLRRQREQAGLGQERLAERAGLSVPAISNLERGVSRPRLETVNLLACALALPDEQRAALLAAARRERTRTSAPAPPPATARIPARHNLPAPPNALLGREQAIAALRAALQAPATRLLTLSGPGGVGKTRLALAVGAELVAHYPDGVWLVELASLADPALVPAAVAEALGLREERHRPLPTTLVEHLRDRQPLFVLDNCEHLLPACAALASALLRACPGVRILATSRERLGISGEQVHPVPPLSVPDSQHLPPPELLGSYEAVRLFVARAQARWPAFTLGEQTARAVVTICARLDGVPLALELAAARVGSLPVEAIAARLDERFALLTLGPRDVLPRQQTLRATMDWSWDLLSAQEQILLRRLSAFGAGGWALEAATALCAGVGQGATPPRADEASPALGDEAVLDLLEGLVSKSLVQVERLEGDGARYRLLETVRQYARERLAEAGEHEVVRLRDTHLQYYAALFATARRELTGPHQAAWMARLDDELHNVRAALAWARQSGQPAAGLRLAVQLNKYWDRKNYQREGRAWLERLLALPGAAALPEAASAFQALGTLAYRQGDHDVAAHWLEHSVALYRGRGDEDGALGAASALANVYLTQGQLDRAIALYEETLAAFRARGRRWDVASSLNNLGEALRAQGAFARAAACYEESLAGYRAFGDLWSMASVLNNLGILSVQQGDLDRAEVLARESLAMNCQLGDRHSTGAIYLTLGTVAATRGDPGTARAHYLESLSINHQRGYRSGVAECLEGLAAIAIARQPELATRLFGAAEALRAADGEPIPPAERAAYEADLAQARAALTPAAFTAAWEAGRALSLEQAIALAQR